MDNDIENRLKELNQRVAELYEQKHYGDALKVAEQALELTCQYIGSDHPDYATAINDLAVLQAATGEKAKAETLYLEALQVRRATQGESHPDYAESLHNLAHLYDSMGRYADAKPLYLNAIEILRAASGEDHPRYKESVRSLLKLRKSIAITVDKINQMNRSVTQLTQEGHHVRALEIAKQVCKKVLHCYGEDSFVYATTLNNLGSTYYSMGQLTDAERFVGQALQIHSRASKKEFAGYTSCLSNLATLCRDLGDLDQEEQLLKQLVQLKAETLGEDHLEYADATHRLAHLYHALGNIRRAESLYKKVIEIKGAAMDTHSQGYVSSLNDLAHLYMLEGAYVKAEPLFRKVAEARRMAKAGESLSYRTSVSNLIRVYESLGEPEKAVPFRRQLRELHRENPNDFSGTVNAEAFEGAEIDDSVLTAVEKNSRYWPPLQRPLDASAKDYFRSGYSEEYKRINEDLNDLYAKRAFDGARSLINREFHVNMKTIDQHEVLSLFSRRLKMDQSGMSQIKAMLWRSGALAEFVRCPQLLKLLCEHVGKGALTLENPSLREELDLYQSAIDLRLKNNPFKGNLSAFFRLSPRIGREDNLLALEEIALALFVNRQTVVTRTALVRIAGHFMEAGIAGGLIDVYIEAGILQALSSSAYKFTNRTVHEYLTARAMFRRVKNLLQKDWVDELCKFWDPALFWDECWIDVIRMFLGFLPTEKYSEFLSACIRGLPAGLGYLEECRLITGQPLLVMVHAPYTSAAANMKIAKILQCLIETNALQYIFTEGDDGRIDRSFYQDSEKFHNDSAKIKLAEEFLKKMTITGQEYFSITSRKDFHLWGVDNKPLWAKLLKLFKEISFDVSDIIGDRKKNFTEYARAQSVSSTIRSVMIEEEAKRAVLVIGAPYYRPFPNAYETLSSNKSGRKSYLLSYIKIELEGLDAGVDSLASYKRMMDGKGLYDLNA